MSPSAKATTERRTSTPTLRCIRIICEPDKQANANPHTMLDLTSPARAEQLKSFGTTWTYFGVVAEAEIDVCGSVQHISSDGIWGMESDSDWEFIALQASEEYADLKEMLTALGVQGDIPLSAAAWVER